jgi:hypothetical protein
MVPDRERKREKEREGERERGAKRKLEIERYIEICIKRANVQTPVPRSKDSSHG